MLAFLLYRRFESELNLPISLECVTMSPSDKANRLYWAERRNERPKVPVQISVADFVRKSNDLLYANPAWLTGTRFTVVPSVAGECIPTWEGPQTMRPLIQRVLQDMASRYELPVPFRIERT